MEAETPCVELVYQQLVHLVARAFYAVNLKELLKEEQPEAAPLLPPGKKGKKPTADFTGLGVVVMDALLFRPWWEEEDFAKRLLLPSRAVRQVLRLLETHSLVAREHRKEKRLKKDKEAAKEAEALLHGDVVEESNEDRGLLISYCSIDYQRFYDMTRFRLHKIRQRLKEELEDRRAVQDYTCPLCGRTYTTLQAPFLIKPDGMFHCEDDDAVLEAGGGQADGMSRRERSKVVKAKQAKLEEELKPLLQVLAAIEQKIEGGDQIPDFGTLASWAAGEAARSGAGGGHKTGAGRDQPAQITIDMGGPELTMGSSDLAPRELPPWLQQQRQNGGQPAGSAPSPSSYSLLQDASGDLKDAKDTRSTSPEDSKKLEELRYMQQYQQRMAQIAAQEAAGPQFKRQKSEAGGWQEVGATAGGWEPVTTASEAAGVKPELQLVKQEMGAVHPVQSTAEGGAEDQADDEWEDA